MLLRPGGLRRLQVPLGHQGGVLVDALGRTQYVQRYTGNAPANYAVYATAKYTYDAAGQLTQILHPDGSSPTTLSYDGAGRQSGMGDPDSGAWSYGYDPDGNLTQSTDARGSSGTVYAGYDGIDRPWWRNTSNGPSGAYQLFGYDSTAGGNQGTGRLTSETFSEPGTSLSGSATYTYDGRGQQTNWTLTVGASNYPVSSSYDDAGHLLTQTYPTGEVVTTGYTAQGWLNSVSTSAGTTTLLSNAGYAQGTNQFGGPAGQMTAATLGSVDQYSATFDALLRATDLKVANGATTLFEQTRSFDNAGNVSGATTTLPAGTDIQAFCYDEQDRLTWAGSTGSPPCGGTTGGTLTAAQYQQSFAYDTLGRLTTGPLGTYSYSSGHLHAANAIGTAYTAAYDLAGNMTCRAPSTSTTCAGTPTGASLTFDNEGKLAAWQNTPSAATTTAAFLYDGRGNRVAQQVTQSGTPTTTVYVGNVQQVATTGATTTTTYYYAGAARIALAVNGVFSYLASDGIGSADVALNATGAASASQLFAPYGGLRYSGGSMPTDYGFTGQHADSTSGLDYYVSRYYDPLAGQFVSADSILPGTGYDLFGLSRFAYVNGNPEARIDPSGHDPCRFEATSCSGATHQPVGPGNSSTRNWKPITPLPANHFVTRHRCTGRCSIIQQVVDDENPPGSPLQQWYNLFVVPTMFFLACMETDICGGRSSAEGDLAALVRGGPGELVQAYRPGMSARAVAYQEEVTGLPRGIEYEVNGVKFDGYRDGMLIDAKGPGYAWAVDATGHFWQGYNGVADFVAGAARQIRAAPQGVPIVWYVAEAKTAVAIDNLFTENGFEGINIVYRPPGS